MEYNSQVNMYNNAWENGLNWIQKLSYILSSMGVFIDQISTRIGLTHPMIYEANQNVKILLARALYKNFIDFSVIMESYHS